MVSVKIKRKGLTVFLHNKVFLYQEFFPLILPSMITRYNYFFLFSMGILQRFGLSLNSRKKPL